MLDLIAMITPLGWVATCAALLAPLFFLLPLARRVQRRNRESRPSGIQVISNPIDAKFMIVAVHGLGAHPEYTWTCSASATGKGPRKKTHLLRDLLKGGFPDARILSFTYNSDWFVKAPVKTSQEIGEKMLDQLTKFQQEQDQRLPIVFIGHSFGGIVIKQALCGLSKTEGLIHDTSGILFLGTPHQGSKLSFFGSVAAWTTGFLGSHTGLLWALQHRSQELSDLSSRFDEVRKGLQDARIYSIYETKPSYILGLLSVGLIVDRDSARGPADETIGVDTDHSGLNKCTDNWSEPYQALLKAIEGVRYRPTLLELGDKQIRDSYTSERLNIERLSGASLPMDQCYINLSIIQDNTRGDKPTSQFGRPELRTSLLDRLGVEEPNKDTHVQLPNLFEPQTNLNGEGKRQPRRILIRGVPGVGKTTLCKKIVHDFIHTGLWNNHFTRLFWIPLRHLQGRQGRYKLLDLFHDQYFSQHNDPELLLNELLSQCRKPNAGGSLFLLDGLDEIWHHHATNRQGLIRELFDQPNVIVTSRPSVQILGVFKQFDLELETVGFYPDQVSQYVKQMADVSNSTDNVKQAKKSEQILDFLDQHPLVGDLVRIPIQLDALCFAWDDVSNEQPQTMTDLYQAVEAGLWSKDSLRLGRSTTRHLLPAELDSIVKDECMLLEKLAFAGLYNDLTVFDAKTLRALSQYLASPGGQSIDQTLRSLSFLRSSDISPNDASRSYYFLHLTLQEYFAARYLRRIWLLEQSFKLPDATNEVVQVEEFIRRYKYLEKFDIVWRFLAGLFNFDTTRQNRYFEVLQGAPLDLLGFGHQRLLMRCLFEVHPSNQKLKEQSEDQLAAWLVFECRLCSSNNPDRRQSLLAAEMEFPPAILAKVLREGDDKLRCTLLSLMHFRRTISVDAALLALSWLRAAPSWDVMFTALAFSKHFFKALNGSIRVDRRSSSNESCDTLSGAKDTHAKLAELRQSFLEVVIEKLTDTDERVTSAATEALQSQLHVPVMLAKIEAPLKAENTLLQRHTISALSRNPNLPEPILLILVAKLESDDLEVQNMAKRALMFQRSIPEKVVHALVTIINQKDSKVQATVIYALARVPNLPEDIFWGFMKKALDNKDVKVLSSALMAFIKVPNPPANIFRELVARMNGNVPNKGFILSFLRARPNLPEDILQALETKIKDEDLEIQKSAMLALSEKSYLPAAVLQLLTLRLQHEDPSIQKLAIVALGSYKHALPEQALWLIVERLEHQCERVAEAAKDALIFASHKLERLPEPVLVEIAIRLEHPKLAAALEIFDATLTWHPDLSENLVQRVAEMLGDDDAKIRYEVVLTLQHAPSLSTSVLQKMAKRLRDDDQKVMLAAAGVISNKAKATEKELYLTEAFLRMVAAGLYYQSPTSHTSTIKYRVIEILAQQPKLPDSILMSLSSIFKRLPPTLDRPLPVGGLLPVLKRLPNFAPIISVSHDQIQGLVRYLMHLCTRYHHIVWYHYGDKLHLVIDGSVIKYEAQCPCSVIQELYPNQPNYRQKNHMNQAP